MTIIQKTDETDDEDTKTEGAANSTLAAQQLYYQRLIWNWGGGKFFNSHSSLGILPIFIFTLFVTTSCEKSLDASVRQKVVSKHKN